VTKDCFVGPDWRISDWIEKGYIHKKRVKNKGKRAGSWLILKTCPEDIKKELREQNIYLFEEDLKKEDIVFWGD
jgi:hypothetical protein